MELNVQRYLRTKGKSLETLAIDHNIKVRVNERLGVCSLNYDQILSTPGPLVNECRALILEMGTWEVCSLPFFRFFNIGEGHVSKDFNWDQFDTLEKLDGSLVSFWHHPTEGWQCATRSVPDAETGLDDTGMTFKQLILLTIGEMGTNWDQFCSYLDSNCCYSFELTAPENAVVVNYPERNLTLTGIRVLPSLRELNPHIWHFWTNPPFPVVEKYEGFSLDAVKSTVQDRDPKEHEGYVLVDLNFNRVKVKSSAYVFMSSRKDSLQKSNKARIELVLSGASDDVVPTLPVYIQDKIADLQARLRVAVEQIDRLWLEVKDIEGDKDFALRVQHTGWATPMFQIRKGKAQDGLDFFKQTTPKRVLDYIKVEEESESE